LREVVEAQLDVPLPLTGPGSELRSLSRAELRDKLWKSQGGPELAQPWPGPVSEIYHGWYSLGRDANGATLYTERESWVRGSGEWEEPGEREVVHYLFQVLEVEMAEVREILYPAPKRKE
jgi:hypothetical protein